MSIESIKEALKAGPTEGRWIHLPGERTVYTRLEDGCRGVPVVEVEFRPSFFDEKAKTLDFIAACNPVAIRELIERLEAAEKDAARLDTLDSLGYSYGFQDMHEGNAWEIRGPFANVRAAIDSAMAVGLAEGVSE